MSQSQVPKLFHARLLISISIMHCCMGSLSWVFIISTKSSAPETESYILHIIWWMCEGERCYVRDNESGKYSRESGFLCSGDLGNIPTLFPCWNLITGL
jgi:hypothetical protein